MPAGVLDAGALVELIVGVPAQDHVAETEALVEGGEQLLAAHVLATQHAVDVENAHLDVAQPMLIDQPPQVRGACDLGCIHGAGPPVSHCPHQA